MQQIHLRKRLAHKRRVQTALHQILNDPSVMVNANCPDFVVSVSRVEFGRTVREVYIDVVGRARAEVCNTDEPLHDKYMREAKECREETYIDLTDMFVFTEFTEIIARALQERLSLQYTPVIRLLCDLGL
ncbi:MAG: hypothetical protein HON04_20095 [Planctomicrobium sp.]|jgi:hypothetical protein|nr:hypothetical protein [Planctomicrobium sp.]